jgi:hypothetical protein
VGLPPQGECRKQALRREVHSAHLDLLAARHGEESDLREALWDEGAKADAADNAVVLDREEGAVLAIEDEAGDVFTGHCTDGGQKRGNKKKAGAPTAHNSLAYSSGAASQTSSLLA